MNRIARFGNKNDNRCVGSFCNIKLRLTDADGFEGAGRLGELVRAHGNVERILCGHIHLNAHARWCGTTVSTAPAASGLRLAST